MVLGISPGTRTVGIAVLQETTLIHYELLSFPQKWSAIKKQEILQRISLYLTRYGITQVAIKIPDELPISTAYIQVVSDLNTMCDARGMTPTYFTLSELKQGYLPDAQVKKETLIRYITKLYPDLHIYTRKESKDRKYYDKVYEAVGSARLAYLYSHLPK